MPSEQVIGPDEARIAPRTNMFIAAILQSASGACPVRIRNMSPSGALIEAPVLPPQGEVGALIRGDLRVTGTVAWSSGSRCGVRLDSAVAVAEWMANPANRQQSRVDRMVAEIKGGLAPGPAAPAPSLVALPAADVRDDIDRLSLLLEAMGEDLSSSPETLMRHLASLQHLDLAGQMLDALRQALDPNPDQQRIGFVRLLSLRHSNDGAMGNAA